MYTSPYTEKQVEPFAETPTTGVIGKGLLGVDSDRLFDWDVAAGNRFNF